MNVKQECPALFTGLPTSNRHPPRMTMLEPCLLCYIRSSVTYASWEAWLHICSYSGHLHWARTLEGRKIALMCNGVLVYGYAWHLWVFIPPWQNNQIRDTHENTMSVGRSVFRYSSKLHNGGNCWLVWTTFQLFKCASKWSTCVCIKHNDYTQLRIVSPSLYGVLRIVVPLRQQLNATVQNIFWRILLLQQCTHARLDSRSCRDDNRDSALTVLSKEVYVISCIGLAEIWVPCFLTSQGASTQQ